MSVFDSPFNQVFRNPYGSPFNAGAGGGDELLTPPAGLGWTPPVQITRSSAGVYSTDYDPTPHLIEGDPGVTTYYVDADTGNDANPGTAISPKKTLTTITGGRVSKLLIKARGFFYRGGGGYVQLGHDNFVMEAWGGAACTISVEAPPTAPFVWTDEGGGVWSAPSPENTMNGINVYLGTDVDSLTRYTYAASLAACQATPGTWFRTVSPAIKHWVHTLDGTSPATGHTIYGTNSSAQQLSFSSFAFDQRIAFHGITFLGGSSAAGCSGSSVFSKRLEYVGCAFKHANSFGALHCTGSATVITYGCTAGPTVFDGFSCHTATGGVGGDVPFAVEINNVATKCGNVSTGANQGSTTHFTGKMVRVNGQYYENADDQVGDVGDGTRSWNLGCAFGPKGLGSGKAGVQAGNNATDIRMWLDGCTFSGLDFDVNTASGGTIYYKNMAAPNINPASAGTVTTY